MRSEKRLLLLAALIGFFGCGSGAGTSGELASRPVGSVLVTGAPNAESAGSEPTPTNASKAAASAQPKVPPGGPKKPPAPRSDDL